MLEGSTFEASPELLFSVAGNSLRDAFGSGKRAVNDASAEVGGTATSADVGGKVPSAE